MPAFKKVNPRGAPPKLTHELIDKICNVMRAGAYPETAVVVNGVSKELFYHWCKIAHGKIKKKRRNGDDVPYTAKEKKIYQDLLHALEKAFEDCTTRDLMAIERAANPSQKAIMLKNEEGRQLVDKDGVELFIKPMHPDWSAAAWRLERRASAVWAPKNKIELTGKDGGPIQQADETEEEKKARRDRIAAKYRKLGLIS